MVASLILRWALSFLRAYWLPILIAMAGSFIAYRLHHAGYVAGVAHEHKAVAALESKVSAYEKSLAEYAAAVAAQKASQDTQAKQARDALARAKKAAQAHDKALSAALDKYRKLPPVSCADEALPEGVL